MATLSFRLPAARHADRRAPVAGRRSHTVANTVTRAKPLAMVTEVVELQPLTGLSCIEVAARPLPRAAAALETVSGSWFDSTWDLQQGLDISEGLPTDLPLDDWLQVYLAH